MTPGDELASPHASKAPETRAVAPGEGRSAGNPPPGAGKKLGPQRSRSASGDTGQGQRPLGDKPCREAGA